MRESSRSALRILIIALAFVAASAQNPFFFECNLCYSPARFITLPNVVVDTGGDVYTCGELRDIAQNGEFGPQSCAIAQDWAADFCGCQGPPITPPPIITTPACEMCTFPEQIMGFPETLVYHPLIGGWECQDLFTAGRGGFLPDYVCDIVKPIVKGCGCRFPEPSPAPSDEGEAPVAPTTPRPTPDPTPIPTPEPPPTCGAVNSACNSPTQCCTNVCRPQGTCKGERDANKALSSLADLSLGGAGNAFKRTNG